MVRYAPDGRVDRVVETPVDRPTCCAFGESELSTLFITTTSQHMARDELAAQPLAGQPHSSAKAGSVGWVGDYHAWQPMRFGVACPKKALVRARHAVVCAVGGDTGAGIEAILPIPVADRNRPPREPQGGSGTFLRPLWQRPAGACSRPVPRAPGWRAMRRTGRGPVRSTTPLRIAR